MRRAHQQLTARAFVYRPILFEESVPISCPSNHSRRTCGQVASLCGQSPAPLHRDPTDIHTRASNASQARGTCADLDKGLAPSPVPRVPLLCQTDCTRLRVGRKNYV